MTIEQKDIRSYGGFTLGPICDMLRHAKKTREIWFGSYFFSWYMEQLVGHLVCPEISFLTPYTDLDASGGLKSNPSLGGKYHDRFVAKSSLPPQDFYEKIKEADQEVRTAFAAMAHGRAQASCETHQTQAFMDEAEIREVLDGYLQIRFLTLPPDGITDKTAVASLDRYLDSLEETVLPARGQSKQTCDRCKTLPGVVRIPEEENDSLPRTYCPLCLLKLQASRMPELKKRLDQKLKNGKLHYPSVSEIAMATYFRDDTLRSELEKSRGPDSEIDDQRLEKIVKDQKGPAPTRCHRYIAIVQADGDRLGDLARSLEDPTNDLSKRLFDFANAAETVIEKHGGVPVYLGGDDILAFLPVQYREGTVLDFMEAASDAYKNIVDPAESHTALSFGVSIAYRKFPLARARESAAELLFGAAKGAPGKNRAAVRLTAHSGSTAEFLIRLDGAVFRALKECLAEVLPQKAFIPRGIHHKLGALEPVLPQLTEKDRRDAFFQNQFNESVHQARFQGGLVHVRKLLAACMAESGTTPQAGVAHFMSMLKLIRFLTGEEV